MVGSTVDEGAGESGRPEREMDPLFDWLLRKAPIPTGLFVVAAVAIAIYRRLADPAPTWVTVVVLIAAVPFAYSLLWRLRRWLGRQPPPAPATEGSERRPDEAPRSD